MARAFDLLPKRAGIIAVRTDGCRNARLRRPQAYGSRGDSSMMALRHVIAVSALLFANAALADNTALTLSQGDLNSDDIGTVIDVAIVNDGAVTFDSAVVTCSFTAKGKETGSASTTLFNLLPGSKGQDQVHMLGPRSDKAACRISATTPAAP
jgi:hypothetical protein